MNAFVRAMKVLSPAALALAVIVSARPAGAEAQTRTLSWEKEIEAPVAEVWYALTTEEGVTQWMVPVADVDFRPGGWIKTHYEADAEIGDPGTITHHIVAYEPERMLTARLTPPDDFPFTEIVEDSWSVWYLEPVSPTRTRFRLAAVNLKPTERFDEYRAFFDRGNRWTLEQLRAYLEDDEGAAASGATAVAEGRAPSAATNLAAAATLEDFAWLTGRWVGGGSERDPETAVNETHYMAPAGGVIPGVMRLYDGDRLMTIELFDILRGEGGLEMRLRHFDGRLAAMEDGPLVLHLTEYDGHRSVWTTAPSAELRLRSEIVPGAGRYEVRTVVTRPDGSEMVIENVMRRVEP